MASRVIYSVVAVMGIAAAGSAAWWYQALPQGPVEIAGDGSAQRSQPAASTPSSAGSAPRAAGVEVAKVERVRLQDDAQSVGSLRSRQSVMLRPEVAGRVRELGFADGATVRKGQVLVQLEDTLQRAEIKQSLAQVSIAQANLKRNQELVAQSFVAQRVLDESNANLQVAEAQLALACARWSRMAILAPFDGTVGIRNVNPGDYVKDGADLVNLEDISSMFADFRLPERFQGKLRLRQSVQVQLDAFPGRMFKARVEAIDPLLDVNGRSVGVRAILPNTMGEPLPQRGRGGDANGASGAAPGGKPGGSAVATAGGRPLVDAPDGSAHTGARAAAGAPTRDAPTASDTAATGARFLAEPAACAGVRDGGPAITGIGSTVAQGGQGNPTGAGARRSNAGAPGPLRPGMFARVTTVFAIKDLAIVVPEEAIVPQGGRQFVVKVVEPAQVPALADQPLPADVKLVSLRQEVQLGVRQLGKVEVLEGLLEGETVVVAGQQRLQRDGTPLRVVELGRGPQRAGAPGPAGAASAPAGAASPSPLAGSAAITGN